MTDYQFAFIIVVMMINLVVRLDNRPIWLNSNGFLYACLNFWQIIGPLEIVYVMSCQFRFFMNAVNAVTKCCVDYFCTWGRCRFCHLLCNSFDLYLFVDEVIIVMTNEYCLSFAIANIQGSITVVITFVNVASCYFLWSGGVLTLILCRTLPYQ